MAEDLGFSNPRSVSNKIGMMKKKYNINLTTASTSPTKQTDGPKATAKEASKHRVRKSTPVRKGKRAAAVKIEKKEKSEDEEMQSDDEGSSGDETEILEVESQNDKNVKEETKED